MTKQSKKTPLAMPEGRKYAYIRVSSDEQGRSGLGLASQESTSVRIGNRMLSPWGDAFYPENCTRPGFFVDVISAYKTPFAERPGGRALIEALNPGDTIIVSRLDRGFRSIRDFCNFLDECLRNDWNFVCESPPISFATAHSRFYAKMFALMAEYESDMKGQRIREALAAKKSRLAAANGTEKPLVKPVPQGESAYRVTPKRTIAMPSHVKPGRILVYIRCSHETSVESGLGLLAQLMASVAYAESLAEQFPQLRWEGKVYTDAAVSALQFPLHKRQFGGQLNADARDGDVIVVLRPDRAFASINDMSNTLMDWKKRGVSVHFAEEGINLSTPEGEMFLSVLVAFSQYERQLAGARSREARAILEGQGKFTGGREGNCPPFWRLAVVPQDGVKNRRLILDPKAIAVYRLIRLLINRGIPQVVALRRVEELLAKRENRPPIPACGVQRRGKFLSLPAHLLPTSKDGLTIYPVWTAKRLTHCAPVWEQTLALWRERKAEEREAIKAISERHGYSRARVFARKSTFREKWDVERRERVSKTPCVGVG